MAAYTAERPTAPALKIAGGAPPSGVVANTKLSVTVSPINIVIQRGSTSSF